MTDSKDWVTIRIPEPTRDAASDDPRTYEEIMQAGLDAGRDQHLADLSEGELPEIDELREVLDEEITVSDEVSEQLDRIEQSGGTAGVDEKTLAEYVADYLVSEYQLPRKVAAEVRER